MSQNMVGFPAVSCSAEMTQILKKLLPRKSRHKLNYNIKIESDS
jgi:hypothetical protein